ncbi:hypothetical protein HanXRQr2_Chr07g0308051 [Helianthus annuus]|uniref:Uncharacterized protein n=1 Tax=Helianthus annuus TaxID=4232 RepID=A0A251VHW0_HELAN|nr:hypothetical protein HanXRQr2_Chr07g0308051 [Helianthus annuus]
MPDLSPDPFHEQICEDSTAYSPLPCYAASIAASLSFQAILGFVSGDSGDIGLKQARVLMSKAPRDPQI